MTYLIFIFHAQHTRNLLDIHFEWIYQMFLTYFWLAGRIKGRIFVVYPFIHTSTQTGKHLRFQRACGNPTRGFCSIYFCIETVCISISIDRLLGKKKTFIAILCNGLFKTIHPKKIYTCYCHPWKIESFGKLKYCVKYALDIQICKID